MESARIRKCSRLLALVVAGTASLAGMKTAIADTPHVQTVFVIAFENHNWMQPNGNIDNTSQTIEQLKGNPAAPFLNSLVDGTSPYSSQVAYTNTYHNLLATPSGDNPSVHPSELSYIWTEAGSALGVRNDNDPFQPDKKSGSMAVNSRDSSEHLCAFLERSGISWRSYQEDVDLLSSDPAAPVNHPARNTLTSEVAPRDRWTVPIEGIMGSSLLYTNPYNGSHRYNYAPKHNPMVFFSDTNGGNTTSVTPQASHYAPLQQLFDDLATNATAHYNWITPDQYNEMHSSLNTDFSYHGVVYKANTDAQQIALGDHFLSVAIPKITSSDAYKHGGAIVIWMDETEKQDKSDTHRDDFAHTLPMIVISPLAHPNVDGKPYGSDGYPYSHSSYLRTMQEIFNVGPYLGDAANAHDLADLFEAGAVTPLDPRDVTKNVSKR